MPKLTTRSAWCSKRRAICKQRKRHLAEPEDSPAERPVHREKILFHAAAKAKSRSAVGVAGGLAVALAVAVWVLWRRISGGQVLAQATSREAKMEILRKIDDVFDAPFSR